MVRAFVTFLGEVFLEGIVFLRIRQMRSSRRPKCVDLDELARTTHLSEMVLELISLLGFVRCLQVRGCVSVCGVLGSELSLQMRSSECELRQYVAPCGLGG